MFLFLLLLHDHRRWHAVGHSWNLDGSNYGFRFFGVAAIFKYRFWGLLMLGGLLVFRRVMIGGRLFILFLVFCIFFFLQSIII